MDIKPRPPRKPPISDMTPPAPATSPMTHAPLPIETPASPFVVQKTHKTKRTKKIVLFSLLGLVMTVLILLAGGWLWYQTQLSAVGSNKSEFIKVTIEQGNGPKMIGQLLEDKGVIRSQQAFSFYTRFTKTQNKLQAGVYRLSPSETTPEIVAHLTEGTVDTYKITFLPGATLAQNKEVLIKAGYPTSEIDAAFSASYDSPLFASKPASSDLEGYIYGETYNFSSNATVKDVLTRTFAQYEQVIEEHDLVAKFQSHGLTLYQGITLASIIQRESVKGDEAQIAQVFYSRLAIDMPLGSDVTYQYIADKTGVARDTNLDSPYNTRRYAGLPPGPIAVPGLAALESVADPASGDYLFFLSGDDHITYYAHTLAEHEANIANHCKVKCSTL